MTRIFISYKSEYRNLAEQVRSRLHTWGYDTWFDHEDIPSGAYFRHEIQKGLESSDIIIGLMTREAFDSREVMWEWDYALYNSHFIALKYDDAPLPYHLAGTQYIDCTHNAEQAFEELREALTQQPKMVEPPSISIDDKRSPASPNNNRQRMLAKVREYWIEGVLEPSLRVGAIDLGMMLKPDAVLRHHDYGDYRLPQAANIAQIFNDMQRELLILGTPGAGKTTLMLQLARALIDLAEDDPKQPLPVVVNLSSWAVGGQALDVWLNQRLNLEYQVPRKVAAGWVDNAELLLLLDGLDEVSERYRDACVEAINIFRKTYPFVDLVVCSRIEEYDRLTDRLDLRGALALQPMSETQVQAYLRAPDLDGVRQLVAQDSIVREMAQTPFLLNALATAYRGQSVTSLDGHQTLEARRDHLFERYFRERFDVGDGYTLKTTHHALTWLARGLTRTEQIIFYIENLQPDWLDDEQRRSYQLARWLTAIILLFSLPFIGLLSGYTFRGPILGLVVSGLGSLLLVRTGYIRNFEALDWSWRGAGISAGVGLLLGMVTTLAALGLQIIGIPQNELIPLLISRVPQQLNEIINGTLLGMSVGAVFGALFGGLFFGNRRIEIRTRPNQGIRRSAFNALSIGLASGLTLGTVAAVAFGWLPGGAFMGLLVTIPSFLVFGGAAVIKHALLRFVLIRSGDTPRNLAHFLHFDLIGGIEDRA